MPESAVVVDTNVFVAAGFNSESSSARLIEEIRRGDLRLVWNDETRRESRSVVEQIPPLSWKPFIDLFRDKNKYEVPTASEKIDYVPDPADRKFAALALAADAALITNDEDLLANRDRANVYIVSPSEYFERR
jgi:putative PIN family toxin of toxin-antitoxin system